MNATNVLRTAGCLLGSVLLVAGGARADIIPIGSTLTFGGTNAPGTTGTWSNTVSFGTTALVDNGLMTLTTSQVPTGPSGEWDVFSLSTVSGGPLVDDINDDWNIVMDYDLSAPVYFDAVADEWTVNGTPVSPITNFSGICCATDTNPILPNPAYYNSGFSGPLPAGVQTDWQQIFADPYSLISDGGINPSTANDFEFALHFDLQTPVPEPRSLPILLVMLSVGVIGMVLRRRRQKQVS